MRVGGRVVDQDIGAAIFGSAAGPRRSRGVASVNGQGDAAAGRASAAGRRSDLAAGQDEGPRPLGIGFGDGLADAAAGDDGTWVRSTWCRSQDWKSG